MTGILVALLIAILVPLFVATWRTSLLGLFAQAVLMGWIAMRGAAALSLDEAATFVDLVVVRGIFAPGAIYLALRRRDQPRRNDVIAPNLLSWTLALALVVMAFRTADLLVPAHGDAQMLAAIAASAFVLGFFVLATSTGIVSQIIGLLRVEDAIALYELGDAYHEPLGIRLAKTGLVVGVVLTCRSFLSGREREDASEREPVVL